MGLTDYAGGSQVTSTLQEGSSSVFNTISSVQNYVNGVANSFVLNPQGTKGIAGFVFDYEGDDETKFETEIPDHFAEDNSAIQDHMAQKPIRITLRGFISDLFMPPVGVGLFGALTTLQSKMGTVDAYLGKYSPQSLQRLQGQASKAIGQVQNYAATAAGYLNQAKNIAALFGGGTGAPTRQKQAYAALFSLWKNKTVFTVTTPWTTLDGMAIETLTFIQPKETQTKSDIIVAMKQMRFVDVQSAQNTTGTHLSRAGSMYQTKTTLGLTAGTPTLLSATPLATPATFGV